MKKLTKITALLLALLLAVSVFTGCNKQKEEQTEEYVYVPTYIAFPFDSFDNINRAVVVGDTVYILANVKDGTRTETWLDENGVEQTSEYDSYATKLFTMKTDGSDPKELPGYKYEEEHEDFKWSNIDNIFVDKDGNVIVGKSVGEEIFDLPADFDPNKDDYYQYYSESRYTYYIEYLDGDGNIVDTKEIYNSEDGSSGSVTLGNDGNWYFSNWQDVIVLDPEGKELYRIADANANSVVNLPDGRIAALGWGESGMEAKVLDSAAKSLGEKIELPDNCYDIVGVNEKYGIIYNDYNNLYGYNLETKTKEKVVSWLDADINADTIMTSAVLENGDVFCITNDWDKETDRNEIVTITRKKASEVKDRKVITLATINGYWEIRDMVLQFNKTNTDYRIKVIDYSEYNTEEDYTLGRTKLNTEIISGNAPDIICCNGDMPVDRYAAKGILEDLTPYIEKTVGMDNLMEPFFNALRDSDGKLYEIYPNFSVVTTVGLSKIVGDGSSWTFDDLNAAMGKLQEGATVFDDYVGKSSILYMCVARNIGNFVNWETGECSFDTDEFKAILEFANSFPNDDSFNYDDYKWEAPNVKMLSGKQLLNAINLDDFDYFRGETFYSLGKDITFVGFPTLDGGGNSFSFNSTGFAMSSTCEYKDVVWEFISQVLSEEYQTSGRGYSGIPSNKKVFEQRIEESMTPTFSEYATEYQYGKDGGMVYAESAPAVGSDDVADTAPADGSGEEESNVPAVEFNKGQVNEQGWYEEPKTWTYMGDRDIPVYAMTELEYNAIMDLINNTTAVARYDESIMNVINEEVQAYFEGQKSVDDIAKMIQSRVKIYVNEQR